MTRHLGSGAVWLRGSPAAIRGCPAVLALHEKINARLTHETRIEGSLSSNLFESVSLCLSVHTFTLQDSDLTRHTHAWSISFVPAIQHLASRARASRPLGRPCVCARRPVCAQERLVSSSDCMSMCALAVFVSVCAAQPQADGATALAAHMQHSYSPISSISQGGLRFMQPGHTP